MTSFQKYSVRNPRTGKLDYQFDVLSQAQIFEKADFLKKNQVAWKKASIEYRIEVLNLWKNSVQKHKEALIEALCLDTGRKWESLLEADLIASSIERWSIISKDFFSQESYKKSSIPFLDIKQDLVPFPLVAVISPWNFPLLLSLIDAIPALLAGCAVIVKPSEVTPRFIEVIQQTIDEVPTLAGILSYVAGDGKTGADLLEIADLVCFTGSTATGRKVYQAACERFIPLFLELGGKDPALVFEGANLDLATSAILWGSIVNAGQSCLSIERVYVEASIFDEFLTLLLTKIKKITLAFPTMESGQIGPIISDKQVKIIDDQLEDAIQKGAKLVYGNLKCQALGGGLYCAPTILIDVNHDMKVMQEETFGPIIPIASFNSVEEAITLANATNYGLSAAVFHADITTALEIGEQLTCGAVSINDAALTAIMHEGEKNAFKMSGIGGTRMGPSAIKRFMRQKTNLIKTNNLADPWWFKES